MSVESVFTGLKVVDLASFIAGPGQDDAMHGGVVAGVLERLVQFGDGGLVEGVEHLRPIDRHIRDRSFFLVQNILQRGRSGSGTHGRPLFFGVRF